VRWENEIAINYPQWEEFLSAVMTSSNLIAGEKRKMGYFVSWIE
jgi:hypothetical protein